MVYQLAQNLTQDLLYGLRMIKRCKGLALGIVVSMGLGVGATASVFSFVDFLVFRPLTVPETDRVVRIANSTAASAMGSFSYPEYEDYAERSQSFSGIVTYQTPMVGLALSPADQPRATVAMLVSGNFFSILQLKPAAGRGFLPEEDSVPGRDAVAVISHAAWQRDFRGAPDAIGRVVAINGRAFTIVGVAPEEFHGLERFVQPEIYVPRMMLQQVLPSGVDASALTNRSVRFAGLFARLKPGITLEQAHEDVGRIASRLELEHPETNKGMKAAVLTQFGYRLAARPGLFPLALVFLSLAFLVLGIACVNVSNLILSTVPARTREMALRVAMGAPRMRLLRQLLLESVILSGAGTLAGLVLASWCARYLSSIRVGSELPLGFQTQVDDRVVIFTFAIGLVSAFMAGVIPAWRCSRSDLNTLLKSSDPRTAPHKIRGRQLLVGGQVAVTALLLVFSGFLLKNLRIAAGQNPGFRVDSVLTMAFDPSIAGYDLDRTHAFYADLLERLRAMPGVKSAAIAQDKPFGVVNSGSTTLTVDGYELPPNPQSMDIRSAFVGNGYFETLDIPIIRGRAFDRRDGANAPRTVIVNETMAQQYWPSRNPIGAQVEIKGDEGGLAEVIGIARNSKYGGMQERPLPFLYRSYDQSKESGASLFVESAVGIQTQTLLAAVREEVHTIAPDMPIFDVRTMQDHVRESGLLEQRVGAQVFTALGGVGLVLGVLGLYGVIAYSVGQRTCEIGIRMAVGASNRDVLGMILFEGLRSSVIAVAVGIGLALGLRGMTAELASYVSPYDPSVYIGVFLLMLIVTGAACYIPARRASMVDPNLTLRS